MIPLNRTSSALQERSSMPCTLALCSLCRPTVHRPPTVSLAADPSSRVIAFWPLRMSCKMRPSSMRSSTSTLWRIRTTSAKSAASGSSKCSATMRPPVSMTWPSFYSHTTSFRRPMWLRFPCWANHVQVTLCSWPASGLHPRTPIHRARCQLWRSTCWPRRAVDLPAGRISVRLPWRRGWCAPVTMAADCIRVLEKLLDWWV